MRDDLNDIKKYYSTNGEVLRHELQQIEFEISARIFKNQLSGSGNILELGCGSGFYSFYFASLGHHVDAIDLTPELIRQAQEILPATNFSQKITFNCADARDLNNYADESYEFIVSMGPMYHLINNNERKNHLNECRRILKKNGKIFIVYLTRAGFLNYNFYKNPKETTHTHVNEVMKNGFFKNHPKDGKFRGYFANYSEIKEDAKIFKDLEFWTLDPGVGAIDEIFNRLNDHEKKAWADLYYQYAQIPDLVGSGRTVMVIGKKE